MKKLAFLVLISCWSSVTVWSQIATGRITDAATGEPLADAAIMVMPSGKGIHSAADGSYRLELFPGKNILTVSFLGYLAVTAEISVKENRTQYVRHFELTREVFEQEQVVVTANKLGTERRNAPMNISIISKSEINETAETNILPVLSARIPGLFITERGVSGYGLAGGSAGKISIRGVGGSDNWFPVLLLIDGQPQFMGMMGHAIPDSYVSSDIEKAEVVKGPASILYGTNAMGGAINLITRRQTREGFSFNGSAMAGSFQTYKYTGSTGYRSGPFHVRASWNHDQSEGHRANSGFRLDNGYLRTGYEISRHVTVDASISRSGFKAYDPGSIYGPTADYDNNSHWVDIVRTNSYLSVSNKFEQAEGGIRAYGMWGDHDIYDGWKSYDANKGFSVFQGFRLFKGNLFSAGFEFKTYGGKGTSASLGNVSGKNFSVNETGGYLIFNQTLFEKLTLNGGVRYDHHSLFGGTRIPQIGAGYALSGKTTFKTLISKGFRNPTIRELYLFPPANPDLKPESMWNYEVTWLQGFAGERGSFDVTAFLANGENLILTVPNPVPPPPVKNANSGQFEHKGLEFSARFRVNDRFRIDGNYSYLHMDAPKISSPVHQVYAGGHYRKGKVSVSMNLQHISKLYTRTAPELTSQTYTLLGGKSTFHLNRMIEIFLSGENLLGQEYQIQYGYPMPGITLFGGLNVTL